MYKFKVGDKVIGKLSGAEGVVKGYNEDLERYYVLIESVYEYYHHRIGNIENWKERDIKLHHDANSQDNKNGQRFKVGDKVRVNGYGNYFITTIGSEGKVVKVYDNSCMVNFTKIASGLLTLEQQWPIDKEHLDIIKSDKDNIHNVYDYDPYGRKEHEAYMLKMKESQNNDSNKIRVAVSGVMNLIRDNYDQKLTYEAQKED